MPCQTTASRTRGGPKEAADRAGSQQRNTTMTEHHVPTGCEPDTVGHDSAGQDEFSTDISRPVVDDARGMETIELYTRPFCRFCLALRRRLRQRGIEFREINIRRDPDARARLRATGNGDDIVPIVHIGNRWLVNPSVNDIAAQYQAEINTASMVLATASARDNNLRWHVRPVPPAGPVVSHSDENSEERPETTYRVHTLTYAARAIRRYRTTVVTCGTPGIVVDVHPAPRTYTVEFQPTGLAGATIRVPALTDADLAHDQS